MIERQVFVTWYTPEERLPANEDFVIATVSGKVGNMTYDHALVLASWCTDDGWWFPDINTEDGEVEVIAWCDLEPYAGGGKA